MRVKRGLAASLFLLFIGGNILAPALHQAECDGEHLAHADGTCALCQIASTPAIAPASGVVLIVDSTVVVARLIPVSRPYASVLHAAIQPRAPPV